MKNEHIISLGAIDSTNNYFNTNIDREIEDYTAVYTTQQTNGRGTRGRKWQEENGDSLAFSLVYNAQNIQITTVPLVIGLAVSKTIADLYSLKTLLKWSNDIIMDSKKLAGILCESKIYSENNIRVVVGVGINLNQTSEYFKINSLPYATSLNNQGIDRIDVEVLAVKLRANIIVYLEKLLHESFEKSLLEEYRQKCYTLNRKVLLVSEKEQLEAYAVNISEDGGLICQVEDKLQTVYSGEVSVRGLYGYL